MYEIKIDGGKATRKSWSTEICQYVIEPVESLVPYLDCPIQIENTTFAQFFAFIEKDCEFYEKAYRSATYGFPIKPLAEEVKKDAPFEGPREWSPRPDGAKPKDIDFVEVYWGCDMDEGVISDYPGFHGWGDWPVEPGQETFKGGIAIEFTPTNNYKHLLLKLDNEYIIYDEKLKPIWTGKKGFRVHDVLRAILYELTWAGDITHGRELPFDTSEIVT